MPNSDMKKDGSSGVPSLFAKKGTSNRNRSHGTSYLNKKRGKSKDPVRRKVNILALIDGAIEDGASDEAKHKAFAERTASQAPVPQLRRSVPPKKSLSMPVVKKINVATVDPERENDSLRSFDRSTKYDIQKSNDNVNNAPNLAAKSFDSHTPAWKARLNKQGRKTSDEAKTRSKSPKPRSKSPKRTSGRSKSPKRTSVGSKSPKRTSGRSKSPKPRTGRSKSPKPRTGRSKSPKTGRKYQRKKSSEPTISFNDSKNFELPLSRDENAFQPKELPPLKKEKKDKKEKKEKKKKKKKKDNSSHKSVPDGDEYSGPGFKIEDDREESESHKSIVDEVHSLSTVDLKIKVDHGESISSINHESVIFRNIQIPAKINERDTMMSGTPLGNIRKNLDETQQEIINFAKGTKQELSDMENDFITSKETIRFQFMKDIHAKEKTNDVIFHEYKKVLDEKQKEIDELRAGNQRLRTTIQKMPKQISEVKRSNRALEDANEEVATHIKAIEKFSSKLQADQEKLLRSSDKCKNHYLPRHRQQLWESGLHLESEEKIKSLYRDCMIKITKQIEKCRQVDLIEQISSMVLETEGEVNPKFDPGFLSAENLESQSSSSSDSDDSDSSDSSDSSSSSSDSEY